VDVIFARNDTDQALSPSWESVVSSATNLVSGRSYVLTGTAFVLNGGGTNTLYCRATVNGSPAGAFVMGHSMAGGSYGTVSFTLALAAAATGPVGMECTAGPMTILDAMMTAVRAASISG